ncbi:ThiJ/PfpI family protein [Apiospora rasikravindrae]|uniref:D-lactate dehydratase n=1 Tax=Apiospora rasikravindrae TaxID=990691 RepID=A0ABR1UAT7_9PEZI
MAPKILVVLTSFGHIEAANSPTGCLSLPTLTTSWPPRPSSSWPPPKGGEAPLDPASVKMFEQDAESQEFLKTKTDVWKSTQKLSTFRGKAAEFDALFYPGGHGPMFDLANDADSIALIQEFVAAGKPVAAVCHGPAVFTNVTLPDGTPLLKGKEATGFSNVEEDQAQMTKYMPFLLEDKMQAAGATYKKAGEPWGPLVLSVDGGKFITGQNPASAKGVGEAILKAIGV